NPSTLSWATDQSVSLGRSLKITKTTTGDSSAWVSENMVDYWSERHYKNVDMKIGAWVKTQGVNTSPTADSLRWYIAYTFYDSAGVLIGQTKLPIDQSVATSTGFVADTNAVGQTVLPKDSWKTIITFVAGKNATGTVWADNFILYGRGGAWAGQNWNSGVGVPTGWLYWLPPNGGNDGLLGSGFENTRVTTEAAHSGLNSLKFDLPFNRQTGDAFVGTKRMLLNSLGASVNAGDVLRISVWIKASNLVPDSAAKYPTTWAVGFTPGFWKGNGNNDGFNNVPGYPQDLQFVFPPVTSFDWTQYYIDVTVPSDPTTKALDLRLHPYARFTGTIYFDDLTVQVIGTTTSAGNDKNGLPKTYDLSANYPNPFNPSTNIKFALPVEGRFALVIYNVLGQRVRTVAQGIRSAGEYTVQWDGRNDVGEVVQTGVYFYRLETNSMALVRKMLFLK
ncbi:MAG: type sorting protein, partial [Bacteroidetes bacterium]|nr:type sorting protein [Bacteroidota bacterium]